VTHEADLPAQALDYLRYLERVVGVPVTIVSTGPRREETLIRGDSALAGRLRDLIAVS
jgi:adenylosuccinate synthase